LGGEASAANSHSLEKLSDAINNLKKCLTPRFVRRFSAPLIRSVTAAKLPRILRHSNLDLRRRDNCGSGCASWRMSENIQVTCVPIWTVKRASALSVEEESHSGHDAIADAKLTPRQMEVKSAGRPLRPNAQLPAGEGGNAAEADPRGFFSGTAFCGRNKLTPDGSAIVMDEGGPVRAV
jgi:hypothetical protein